MAYLWWWRRGEALKVMLVGGFKGRSTQGAGVDVKIDQGMSVYRQHQFRGKIYPMSRRWAGQPHFPSTWTGSDQPTKKKNPICGVILSIRGWKRHKGAERRGEEPCWYTTHQCVRSYSPAVWSCCPSLQWIHIASGRSAAHGCPVGSSQNALKPEGCQGLPTETGRDEE